MIAFDHSDLLCINEVGMSTSHIPKPNDKLEQEIGSYFWKGNMVRFAANGDQEGLFIIVNNNDKKKWFPTNLPTIPAPFEALIETDKGKFDMEFENGDIVSLKKRS
jgi:hypothetical protein